MGLIYLLTSIMYSISISIFYHRLLQLVEKKVGTGTIQKLDALASIWMDDDTSFKPPPRLRSGRRLELFTVEDILHQTQISETTSASSEHDGQLRKGELMLLLFS